MVRTAVKATTKAVEEKDKKAAEVLKTAQSTVDKMASKGVIHKNKAARIKSRLNKQVKSA
jgi:small subunit ribosomal protein S20